jgi:enoyl-CoA hydratase/carnithine racemase
LTLPPWTADGRSCRPVRVQLGHSPWRARFGYVTEAIQKITRQLMGSNKRIVVAIHGHAVGCGFEWLLNCDIVIASENLVASFPEGEWGSFVTGGGTHLLPAAVDYQRAMELLLLGERSPPRGCAS